MGIREAITLDREDARRGSRRRRRHNLTVCVRIRSP